VLAFNEFAFGTVALKPAPWGVVLKGEWTDHEDRLAADWLQKQGILVSVDVAGQAIQTAARDRPIHPVKSYLHGLKWDGVPRVDTWLSDYLGAENTGYARAVGSRWLLSAVARIFRPGAKADCCLILEGPQGIRKSTALKTLAGEFFTDELADLGSKDAAMQTRGVWIIELSELDSLSHSEVARIKAFMSRTTDRFRPPYGMRLVESPRQCVFAGTVNHSTYLRDETGGRRFWPITCGRIEVEALARDRDQLWAEAGSVPSFTGNRFIVFRAFSVSAARAMSIGSCIPSLHGGNAGNSGNWIASEGRPRPGRWNRRGTTGSKYRWSGNRSFKGVIQHVDYALQISATNPFDPGLRLPTRIP